MRSIQNLSHLTVDAYLKVGDLAIDATIKHGDITRFLASRVGEEGKVLAFSDQKTDIDDVATSLFLSGLHERVDLINQSFTAIPNYLDPSQPVGAAFFQVDATLPIVSLLATIKPLLMALKENGLLVFLAEHPTDLAQVSDYAQTLPTKAYDVQSYTDLLTDSCALLIQRH